MGELFCKYKEVTAEQKHHLKQNIASFTETNFTLFNKLKKNPANYHYHKLHDYWYPI